MCLVFLFADEKADPQMGSGTARVAQMESGRVLEVTCIRKGSGPQGRHGKDLQEEEGRGGLGTKCRAMSMDIGNQGAGGESNTWQVRHPSPSCPEGPRSPKIGALLYP